MNISKLLNNADDAYINYRHRCEALAKEAQKYIDWDNGVSCEHLPADGLCILATFFFREIKGGNYRTRV